MYFFVRSSVRPSVDGVCNEKVGVASVGLFFLPLLILRWRIGHEGFLLCWARGRVSTQLECSLLLCSHLFFFCLGLLYISTIVSPSIYLYVFGISLSAFCVYVEGAERNGSRSLTLDVWLFFFFSFFLCVCLLSSLSPYFSLSSSNFMFFSFLSLSLLHYVY